MAKRTASAKKQARAGVRRALRNRAAKSEIKTLVVKARKALADRSAEPSERATTSLEALRALDRAAAKGIVHRNNAARRKGRLARQVAKLGLAAPAPAAKGKKAEGKKAEPAAAKAAAPAKSTGASKKK
jgi:small subunit ribosomal protein S20